MTLLTLSIPLLKVNSALAESYIPQSYESGFTLLDFESSMYLYEGVDMACGIFSMLQLLLSITTMILAVLSIFVFDKKQLKKILLSFSISCIAFIGLYMVWGFVFVSLYKYLIVFTDKSWGFFSHQDSTFNVLHTAQAFTSAYIGFIIGVFLLVAYIVCSLVIKDDFEQRKEVYETGDGVAEVAKTEKVGKTNDGAEKCTKTEKADVQPRQSFDLTRVNKIAEALKQYKDLLDSGIITQEEFNKLKQEILG